MDWVKSKVHELSLTAALFLAGLQIITPMFVDLLFDGLIIGLLYVSTKINTK